MIYSLSNSRQHATIDKEYAGIYWEKALSYRQKKLPMSVLYGTQILYFKPNDISVGTSFSRRKYCYAHSLPKQYIADALWQSCIIYLYFFFLADLNSLDTTFVKRTCYSFFIAQKLNNSIVSNCDQIHRKLRIWSHLLKKSSMETSFFANICVLKSMFKILFKFNTTAMKQSLFIQL